MSEEPRITVTASVAGVERIVVSVVKDASPGIRLLEELLPALADLDRRARDAKSRTP